MRTKASRIIAALFVIACCSASVAHAIQYPPAAGPLGCNPPNPPDTLIRVEFIQNPNLPDVLCHPTAPDTVWGIAGIITGFDPIANGFAIYIQNSDGNPWGGVDVFTGGDNYIGNFTPNLAPGDSIVAYGRMDEFQGETELRGFASSAFSPPNTAVRRISIGNALPPFKRGTVNYFQELPTNPNSEQWEGCLVRVSSDQHKLRVVRSTDQNSALNTPSSFIAVDNVICPTSSPGPCDSLFVDGSTLALVGPPLIGALVDSVQGIYDQRTRGYRIQVRSGNDMFDTAPPNLLDAYPIAAGDSIRLVFDRDITTASAQNTLNYTLGSTGFNADGAKQQVDKRVVHLRVTTASSAPVGGNESVTVGGVVNNNNGQTMTGFQTRNFYAGILPITMIQAPDPGPLAASPCEDRSKFALAGNQATGGRMSVRGICTAAIGSTYWIEDAAGGARSGVAVFAPIQQMSVGRKYLLAGGVQEFFGETEVTNNVFIRDELPATAPTPVIKTVHVLRDTSCDVAQVIDNGEDYEGVLVKLVDVKTVDERSAGQNFFVAGQYPTNPDTILIDNNVTRTFDPTKDQYVTVTGISDQSFAVVGTLYRIQPRGNADIVVNPTLGVDEPLPTGVSFGIAPNPGPNSRITFGLPTRQKVRIGVYDLAGRQRAVLADAEFAAGPHSLSWDGRDTDGAPVGAGVYFYKMKLGSGTYSRRGILLH